MFKTIKSAFRSIALASTIIYGAIIAPEVHNHFLRFRVGESVVQVLSMTSNGGGTGFAVQGASGTNYIMTNRHVCEVQVNGVIRVKVADEKPIFRKVIFMDSIHDLCLVEGVEGLSPVNIGSNQDKGDFLFVVGHPGLRQLTTSQGEYIGRKIVELEYDVIKREDCPGEVMELPLIWQVLLGKEYLCVRQYEALATSAVIYPGNSGSPVVNKFGNLIGVAFAGSNSQERDNFIVPLRYVVAVLNQF